MRKINKNAESPHKSYLVEAKTFNEHGEPVEIPGVVSKETCRINAKSNHRMCEGRGILHFDNGRYFHDLNGERRVLVTWVRSCDCASRKFIKNEEKGDFSHLRG